MNGEGVEYEWNGNGVEQEWRLHVEVGGKFGPEEAAHQTTQTGHPRRVDCWCKEQANP